MILYCRINRKFPGTTGKMHLFLGALFYIMTKRKVFSVWGYLTSDKAGI